MRLSTGFGVNRPVKKIETIAQSTLYNFAAASPAILSSYTRTSTNEFYRNSSGKFINAASNEARYDYDFNGNPLGLRFDPPSTNKCTNTNWNMSNLTGLTIGGNASATVTISTHPVHGHPTILVDNTLGGSGSATVTIAGTVGNTNPHSMSVMTRSLTSVQSLIFTSDGMAGAQGTAGINKDEWLKSENFIPTSAARQVRLQVPLGGKCHFWLNQLEELDVATFPLLVNGATSSRTVAAAYFNLSSIPTYTEAKGAVVVEAVFDRITNAANQYIVHIGNGIATAETLGLYAVGSNYGQLRTRTAIASGAKTNNDIHCPIRGRRFPMAFSWKDGQTLSVAGPMTWNLDSYTGTPTGMTRLNIGGRGTIDPFCGWIRTITVVDQFQSLPQLAPFMFPAVRTYRAIMLAGQSNMHGRFRSTETKQNGGEIAAITQMDAIYTDSENWVLRTAINGSAADRANDSGTGYTNWWYDRATAQFGPTMAYAKSVATAFGKSRILPIIGWDQGASDTGDSVSNLKTSTKAIFDEFVNFLGAGTKIIICPISRRQDAASDNYETVKQAQRELVTENPSYILEAPPQDNITLGSDNLHMSNASYASVTTNLLRKMLNALGKTISGAIDPPRFTSATRSGTTVTIPIIFPTGISAMTPTTSISGFRCFDGDPSGSGTEIAVTAANYAGGNITLTLAADPVGTLYVQFARGGLFKEFSDGTLANLARGNDTNGLSLAWNKVIAS